MTAIRPILLALLCALTTGISLNGASASDNGLSEFISEIAGSWTCQADQSSYDDTAFSDAFHAEALNTSLNLPDSEPSQLSLVAATVWESLWASEHVLYEFVSEKAFRLVFSAENTDENTLTCTQQIQTTDT